MSRSNMSPFAIKSRQCTIEPIVNGDSQIPPIIFSRPADILAFGRRVAHMFDFRFQLAFPSNEH